MSTPAYVDHYRGPRSQSLRTPRRFYDRLDAIYAFTMDGAADAASALAPRYSSIESSLPWKGERVFCNPPWSDIRRFVELAATADLAVLLVPARTNCGWFWRALELGARVRFFEGKLRFGSMRHTSPVDCLLLVFEGVVKPEDRHSASPGRYCYFRLDAQTACMRTARHGSHVRWESGDRHDTGPNGYSHPFTPEVSAPEVARR